MARRDGLRPPLGVIVSEVLSPDVAQQHDTVLEQFDPTWPQLQSDPYGIYRRYRNADPVHWGKAGLAGYPGAWYLFRHADVTAVLRDSRFGKTRPVVRFSTDGADQSPTSAPAVPDAARVFFSTARQWIVHRDPPEHTRLRRLLRASFAPTAVSRLRPRIAEIADELLDRVEPHRAAEVISDYALPLPIAVISEMLSVPPEGRPLLSDCSSYMQAVDLATPEQTWRQAGEAITAAMDYLAGLVAERTRRPGDDLISLMVAGFRHGNPVSRDEMLANILFLFVAGAGFQTTTGLIGNGIYSVLSHPAARQQLLGDPSLIRPAIEELLRFEPPVQMTNRIAAQDVPIGAKVIRTGDSVLAVLASSNRDPEAYPDPDRLDLTRRAAPHHAFGVGIHFCLGGGLAVAEGEVAIDRLLRRLSGAELAEPATWAPMVSLRVLRSLRISW